MNRAAWILITAMVSTRVASAEVRVLGWTADGKFVIDVNDPRKSSDFGKGQERFLATCAAQDFAVAQEGKTPACAHCGAATDDPGKVCGLASKPAKIASNLASPDRKLTLAQRSWCVQQSGGGACAIGYSFGQLGSIDDVWAGPTKKPRGNVWWRPDSNAVMIDVWNTNDGVREDRIYVVDVTDLRQRGDVPKLLAKRVAEQLAQLGNPALYTRTAVLFTDEAARGAIAPDALAGAIGGAGALQPDKVDVGVTFDGRAAWAAFTTTTGWRVTELFVREGGEWRIASGFWSRGIADKDADAKARSGQLGKLVAITTKDVFAKELESTVEWLRAPRSDSSALARTTTMLVVGTAPNERSTSAKPFEQAWRAWGKTGLKVDSIRAETAHEAAWLIANIEVAKTKNDKPYSLPVRAWVVIDNSRGDADDDGIVLVHLAVAKP